VPDLAGGTYIGPHGFAELWGSPVRVTANSAARDTDTAARLWDVSESLTGVSYVALSQARA
jgi:hypothetical protein